MKKTTLVFTVFAFFLVSSCLPSLHSIVNDENRVTDDRLVGEWKMEEDIFDDATIKFDFSVSSDDEEDIRLMKELGKEIKQIKFGSKKKYSSWKFERAAKIVAKDEEAMTHPKGHGLTVTLSVGTPSMLPKDRKMTIVEKKEFPFYILTYRKSNGQKRVMRVDLTKINGGLFADFYPFGDADDNRFSMNYIHAHTFAKVAFVDGKITMQSFNIDKIEELLKSKRIRLKHETISKIVRENNSFVTEENLVLTASTEELRAFISKFSDNEDLFDEAEELTAYNEKNP